ncbi:MAG: ferritin [Ignavibacteriales bacterium]|jgi:ferritin|nr:ferritin [Ignavibacteriales bacterium]HOJ18607.1 ferritin [Ignavibacteriaceae bacterium]
MLSKKMEKALNDQIQAELYSSYLYLAMSAYFESQGWAGFASWMRVQSDEERTHAMKIYDFIFTRGGKAVLQAIEAPQSDWKSVNEVFEETYKHEQKVTSLINNLVAIAISENDYATKNFLDWFVDEQVEEEENCVKILDTLKLIGDSKHGLYMFSRELGSRAAH